jgi:hypothetical protein
MTQLPNRTNPDYFQGSVDAAATLWGYGTTSSRVNLGTTANQRALAGFFETEATTGDTRGMDVRLHFSGAGGSGEAFRAFGVVNGVTAATGGTVNGAHISMSINGAAGAISGAGNALRATLGIGTGVVTPGGTLAAIQVDSDIASAVTPPSGSCFFMRFTNSGSVAIPDLAQVPTASNGTIFAAHGTDAMTHSLRIRSAAGTVYYIMCTATATNRS